MTLKHSKFSWSLLSTGSVTFESPLSDFNSIRERLISKKLEVGPIKESRLPRESCVWQVFECGRDGAAICVAVRTPLQNLLPIYVVVSTSITRFLWVWRWRDDHRLLRQICELLEAGGALPLFE